MGAAGLLARRRFTPGWFAGSQGGGQISATQQAEFGGNGWTVLPSVFGAGQRAILVQAALRVLERPGPEVSQIGSVLFQKIFSIIIMRRQSTHESDEKADTVHQRMPGGQPSLTPSLRAGSLDYGGYLLNAWFGSQVGPRRTPQVRSRRSISTLSLDLTGPGVVFRTGMLMHDWRILYSRSNTDPLCSRAYFYAARDFAALQDLGTDCLEKAWAAEIAPKL